MRTGEPFLNAESAPRNKKAPPPRDYWIFDQVVRRHRTETDVALDLRLSQPRISQICAEVGAWMDRVAEECLPEAPEQQIRAMNYLINLRRRAQVRGLVPQDENLIDMVTRTMSELAGVVEEKPGAYWLFHLYKFGASRKVRRGKALRL